MAATALVTGGEVFVGWKEQALLLKKQQPYLKIRSLGKDGDNEIFP